MTRIGDNVPNADLARFLLYVDGVVQDEQRSPTFHEIRKALGYTSTSIVDYRVRTSEARDYLRRDATRSMKVTVKGRRFAAEQGDPRTLLTVLRARLVRLAVRREELIEELNRVEAATVIEVLRTASRRRRLDEQAE